jgi:hypothetical protein
MGTTFILSMRDAANRFTNDLRREKGPALLHWRFFRFAAFTGILVVVCAITRKARPILPDERGKPVSWAPFLNEGQKGVVSFA